MVAIFNLLTDYTYNKNLAWLLLKASFNFDPQLNFIGQ